jgi:hypothetical protein
MMRASGGAYRDGGRHWYRSAAIRAEGGRPRFAAVRRGGRSGKSEEDVELTRPRLSMPV